MEVFTTTYSTQKRKWVIGTKQKTNGGLAPGVAMSELL